MNFYSTLKEEHLINYVKEETTVYRTYKDRVFRMLFREKKRLLELYNALNHSAYTREEDLLINTLENAIFMKMKNDVSFIIDESMCLYEHQSSYCPNMPLRGFLYFADLYKLLMKDVDLSSSKRIVIPTPYYIVFYNGTERKEEEFNQKLSESFEDSGGGCMELVVRTININYGHNEELMNRCRTLSDYAKFVDKVRRNRKVMEMERAVREAVDECIREDILKDFLTEQKAEVIAMSIYEYNEDYVKRTSYEVGFDAGETQFAKLTAVLLSANRLGDLQKAAENKGYRKQLLEEYQISNS